MTKIELNTLIEELATDLKPVVSEIESSIATTRHNYGRYGSLLNQLSKGSKQAADLLALAMIKAGAHKQGVADGLKNFC